MSGAPAPACAPGVTRMLNAIFTSPVDRLIFPSPRPSYDDAAFPWSESDLIWLRDPHTQFQFPVAVIEPMVCARRAARGSPRGRAYYALGQVLTTLR